MSLSLGRRRVGLASACALLLLSGCSSSKDKPALSTSTGGLTISHLAAVESPSNVLAYDVSWKTSRDADTALDVRCSGLEPWTLSDSTAASSHHVFLMGLVTGAKCTLTAKAKSADGGTATYKTTIKVSKLPSYLPPIELTVPAKAGTVAPGWTLVNLSNERTVTPYIAALIDPEGRFRWYYQYPGNVPGNDTPVSQYKDGVLIGGRGIPLSYVTWQGELVWADDPNPPPYFHHEARAAETPNEFYTLSTSYCSGLTNPGDDIVEWDSVQKTNVWTWHLCDHYTPAQDVPDWPHMNAVSLFPDHKFLLSSSRNQNSIFKINRATGDLIWTMGYHGEVEDGFHGDFTVTDADRFYHQHDTTVLPNGHILMFDNGRAGVREWSRGLELAYTYDPSGTSEAHVVWQFRHKPDIFAPIWGSTQRFKNGNTLICFGERDPGVQSTIVEVTKDSQPLWEFRSPEFWGIYRAQRIAEQRGFVIN